MQHHDAGATVQNKANALFSRRLINWLGFAVCVGMLAVGYFMQYVMKLEPCPMCILERIAFFCTAGLFLLAALHDPRAWGAKVWGTLLGVTAGAGLAIALRHVWLQNFPPENPEMACGMGLDYLMDVFSPGEVLTMILTGTADCTEVQWTFLGLSIPGWAAVWFALLFILGVGRNWLRA